MRIFILFFSLLIALPSQAEDRYNWLFARQELLHKTYKQVYLDMTDINRREALKMWYRLYMEDNFNRYVYEDAMRYLPKSIAGRDFRELLFYYVVTGQGVQANQLVGLYVLSLHTLLDNFAHDPQSIIWNQGLTERAKKITAHFDAKVIKDVESCFANYSLDNERSFNTRRVGPMQIGASICIGQNSTIRSMANMAAGLFYHKGYYGSPFAASFTGHVGGNQVDLHNAIPTTAMDILNLGEQLNKVQTAIQPDLQKSYAEMTVEDFQSLMATPEDAVNNIFSRKEGFQTVNNHLSLGLLPTGRDGIFASVLKSIKDAKESVFIDVFWMGGSIGMNLAKELMKKTIENPNFQVFIISDNENKFAYGKQLDIITRYMQAFSQKFTHLNFYFAPANINLKRTALPEFMDLLFTNKAVNGIEHNTTLRPYLEKDGFHLLAKSDHTKTFVIDGKNPELGVAYVGSKNWTDASGGIALDDVVEIHGPGVALVLNSFYYDVLEAYKLEAKDGFVIKAHLDKKAPGLSTHKAVQKILEPIDIIDRVHSSSINNIDLAYVEKGDSVIAPGQNNIYGTEMSAVEQNIQVILGAKKQIMIDDQFLWDPSISDALTVAMKKNKVKVYIMLNPMQGVDATSNDGAHIPNNLFLPELIELGAQAKWKVVPPTLAQAILKNKDLHGDLLSPEFHVKSISVDGVLQSDWQSCQSAEPQIDVSTGQPVLVSGSANKDVLTMTGGFREYQVLVYDKAVVARHDCLFWARWFDDRSTETTDGMDFEIPQQGKDLGITDKKDFLNLLRMLIFAPYNFTKDFIN
ncbi:MAG: hypothetical protein KDD33_10065 [Bdellovibrionales bacterium]|nr:hypothetical protein [Bdellovibrionales bacterium]